MASNLVQMKETALSSSYICSLLRQEMLHRLYNTDYKESTEIWLNIINNFIKLMTNSSHTPTNIWSQLYYRPWLSTHNVGSIVIVTQATADRVTILLSTDIEVLNYNNTTAQFLEKKDNMESFDKRG